ncbi:capsid protein [Apis mellifera virus-11]|nr:capsid protein [Apis mellifera virus-11]
MPFYRKRSLGRRRTKRYRKKRRTAKRRKSYGRRRTYRKGAGFRRAWKKRASKPILFHVFENALIEITQANMEGQVMWQYMDTATAFTIGRPSDMQNQISMMINTLSAASAGVFVENMEYRDLHVLLDKAWMRLEFTNLGNFPTHVEAYVIRPRRNIGVGECASPASIFSVYMNSANASQMGEQVDGGASISPRQYGMTPYMIPGLTANFVIKKKFYQLMPPGSVGAFTVKMAPKFFNNLTSYQNSAFDSDALWTFTRCVLWRVWTVPLAAKLTTAAGGLDVSLPGPFKIGVLNDTWYKYRANFAGGYRAIWQESNTYPTTVGTGGIPPQYMNPDTGAAQQYDEAGD